MMTALLATTDPHPMAWTAPMRDAPCTIEDTTAALHRATMRDTTATKSPSFRLKDPFLQLRLVRGYTHLLNLKKHEYQSTGALLSILCCVSFVWRQQPHQPPINFDFLLFPLYYPHYYRNLGNSATPTTFNTLWAPHFSPPLLFLYLRSYIDVQHYYDWAIDVAKGKGDPHNRALTQPFAIVHIQLPTKGQWRYDLGF